MAIGRIGSNPIIPKLLLKENDKMMRQKVIEELRIGDVVTQDGNFGFVKHTHKVYDKFTDGLRYHFIGDVLPKDIPYDKVIFVSDLFKGD